MAGANKLTVAAVRAAAKPGRLSDGNRLYLNVSKAGTKSWVVLYVLNGRQREMGLGSADVVSLAAAREHARAAADLIAKGLDPLAERVRPTAVETKRHTFGEVVEEHLTAMGPSWRNAKHRDQWAMTLRTYGEPLKALPVADVTTADVLTVLRPIWSTKPETASRLRGRIEAVLDRAKAMGWRTGENAAAWKGNLALVLPSRAAGSRGHHAALPYAELPAFMKRLATVEGTSAKALAFTILAAARSGESLNATWSEFDAGLTVWTVPASRMKGGREHRVPLNDAARAILRQQQASRLQVHGEWVFPGAKPYRPLSNMAMELVLRRLGVAVTPHGFRSSFRDWCAEKTNFPSEVAELALAHQVGSKVERAYRRSDLFDRRAELMREWAAFLAQSKSFVETSA